MHEPIMNALKSDGFHPIVSAIQQRCPAVAEAMIREAEIQHQEHESEYTAEENIAIGLAFEECEKRIDRLWREVRGEVKPFDAVFGNGLS